LVVQREQELAVKEEDFNRRATELDTRAAELEARLAALVEREDSVAVADAEADQRIESVRRVEAELVSQDKDIAARTGHQFAELAQREQALLERLATVERREAALAGNEQAAAAADAALAERLTLLQQRESALDERMRKAEETLLAAETRLADASEREATVAARAHALAERERALVARLGAAVRADEGQLAAVQKKLENERLRLDHRAREVDALAHALQERERELELRGQQLVEVSSRIEAEDTRLLEPAPGAEGAADEASLAPDEELLDRVRRDLDESRLPGVAAIAPFDADAFAAAVTSEGATEYGWRIEELHELVQRNAESFPERLEEWQIYLSLLHRYVDVDGRLPDQFDWLVEETFGEILPRRTRLAE
jgi:hypothetical protein